MSRWKHGENGELHDLPTECPVTHQALFVSELASEDGSVTIRGRFRLPSLARLDPEQQRLLEVFLRSRGTITTMEKELGLSYPTVRSRIDGLLQALGLEPYREATKKPKSEVDRGAILEELESGKITAAQAKARLRGEEVR
ncbi:MAG: DUF2089 domain-containing protein [Fimbriimonadaceae bacterium]|nr:DUF2089 domain-containing protein [Fimbriimonadaceae bacterium]QYK55463.1 MAG: DUF2089 domain-containing protein [Fimbriimonadaceae bacterium]